ncbi:hypothetical protein M3P05_11390 [Sansalvadorimonas sp. 2012CJ34-2]|uniref:Uncharacterized protein n=1 Tax=Parendozoicomonas callyspongiae TaxID=2942213 RepID=A0ABT0PH01_9GAMM|nr:hypothetical protein [Sansalvadorimonas sp. 2012CJ34-2]MCL6270526.1 hypothetical protein [Sansalvadorimonas sp. 2012CJ34-2]
MSLINRPKTPPSPNLATEESPLRPKAKTRTSRTWFGHTSERIQGQINRFLSPQIPRASLQDIPLKSRLIYIVKSVVLMIISVSANYLIKAISTLEDALVNQINKARGISPKPGSQRQTLFSHLAFPHAEAIKGTRYPHGIPQQDLHLYTNPTLLVVEGGEVNRFGHAVIMFGDPSSGEARYIQISSGNNYPEHMTSTEFDDFLEKWGCQVSYEVKLPVSDNTLLQKAVNNASMAKWRWGGPTQNCLAFAYRLVDASGGDSTLLKQFDTVSNEYPALALQGVGQAIHNTVQSLPDLENPDDIEEKLCVAASHAAEKTPCNPAMPKTYFHEMMNQVLKELQSLNLPDDVHRHLKKALKRNCIPKALEFIENSAVKFTRNIQRHHADLPLDAARNMPVGLRNVGPQTHRGFNEDNL